MTMCETDGGGSPRLGLRQLRQYERRGMSRHSDRGRRSGKPLEQAVTALRVRRRGIKFIEFLKPLEEA